MLTPFCKELRELLEKHKATGAEPRVLHLQLAAALSAELDGSALHTLLLHSLVCQIVREKGDMTEREQSQMDAIQAAGELEKLGLSMTGPGPGPSGVN